jgi:hypothetical protein
LVSASFEAELNEAGFTVLPGPAVPGGPAALADAYDRAVATADPSDVSVRSSTRVHDFVFDPIYVHEPLLAACHQIIGTAPRGAAARSRARSSCARPGRRSITRLASVPRRANASATSHATSWILR